MRSSATVHVAIGNALFAAVTNTRTDCDETEIRHRNVICESDRARARNATHAIFQGARLIVARDVDLLCGKPRRSDLGVPAGARRDG
jgi:hypothetical protein